MPANLPPAYRAAEDRLRAAVTPEEKVAALEEMLRLVPKHKGTEKIQAGLKSRISRLRRQEPKKAGGRGFSHHIPSEGAGQVVLAGPPNAGKSALVDRLTHATPEVAEYPFTTRQATPGMMPFEDVAIQLVDLPPICDEHVEPWVWDLVRTSDLVWLVLDAEAALEGIELVERLLGERAIALAPVGAAPADEPRPGWTYKPALMVLTGIDRPAAREDVDLLAELVPADWPRLAVSSVNGEGLDELAATTFAALGVIRVYSKQPGKPPDLAEPFTLPAGSTVDDLARRIHKDLAEQLRYARLWGAHVHDAQRVTGHHLLEEGDVVEIHV